MRKRKNKSSPTKSLELEHEHSSNKFLPKWLHYWIYEKLWEPIDPSSLIFFRVLWGLIMSYECFTYTTNNFAKLEYILRLRVHFKYPYFEWVPIWSSRELAHLHMYVLIFLGFCIALGFLYRLSTTLFFFMFSFLYLQEATLYLNHLYLVCIISFMMIFLPLNQCWSLDSLLSGKSKRELPYWSLWLPQVLVAVVYLYAGIAKMNIDWLRGEPLIHWLRKRGQIPFLGYFLKQKWVAILFSYGGLLLDTFIGIAFLSRNKYARFIGFMLLSFFHTMNKIIFNIGIFPWMMLVSTTIYFDSDWVTRLFYFIQGKAYQTPKDKPSLTPKNTLTLKQKLILLFIFLFLSHQILVPLRHHLYEGDVNWNEEGHRWSWRMKLRDKQAVARFFVHDHETGEKVEIEQNRLLTRKQQRKISCRPDLLQFFAHWLADQYQNHTGVRPTVTAEVICSLNFRPFQYLVKPDADLAAYPLWSSTNEWLYDLVPLGTKEHWAYAPPPIPKQ